MPPPRSPPSSACSALELPARLRYEVAGAVGSDVPFFLWPGPQLAMGRGTVLKEIALPEPLHVVIALPGLAPADRRRLSLARRRCGRRPQARRPKARLRRPHADAATRPAAARRPRDLAALVGNELEAPVVGASPRDRRAGLRLRAAGAFAAAMSGSGSSVFGLFASAASAQRALAALAPTRAVYVTDLQPTGGEAPGAGGDTLRLGQPSRSAHQWGVAKWQGNGFWSRDRRFESSRPSQHRGHSPPEPKNSR